jgi:hypothetical protein
MWIYRIIRGGQRAADLKSQGKVNPCGVESCERNLRQLAIAVTPLSILGSDDQRMDSIKCRFEGAKRQSFQNDQRLAAARKYRDVVGGWRIRRAGDPLGSLESVSGAVLKP